LRQKLGVKAVSGRTLGLNGRLLVDLNPAVITLGAAVFIQASADSFGNTSFPIPLPGFFLL
jgi:hypothetical protein